jgi:cell division protein FtsI/penicillin-binding protein 2
VLIRKHSLRFSLVFIFLITVLLFFSVKLILIQVFRSDYLAQLAEKQQNYSIELEPVRGSIYDRQLRLLALNIPAFSLFANPRSMSSVEKEKAIRLLPKMINIDGKSLHELLKKKKYFVWIKRKLSLDQVDKIRALKIKGLDFMNESKRFYPNGSLAAHIIGFAGIDNEGLEGMELMFNKYLKGEAGVSQVLRDAKQRHLMIEKNYVPPRDGSSLVLTLDETIQYIAERELDKAFEKHNAKGGSIIVMDVKTGEILALANRPTYNLEYVARSQLEARTNRAVNFVYEPGSVFKIVALSAALEQKKFVETDKIFCENGEYRVANHILHDHHPHGTLTFRGVFEQSSNIGVTKVAQRLGPDLFYQYARRFRFGVKTGVDLAGEVNGLLKPPSQWSKTTIGAIPIGHEVTTTPLQLVSAIAAIANDGLYMKPLIIKYIKDEHNEIIKSFEPQALDQIIAPETAKRVKEILVGAVESGTGKQAMIPGMRVAGKTGTAQKVVGNSYSHDKFYASFIGFAPADNPRLAAIVVFDEPHPNHFGGTVSAPVFKEVIENALRYLDNTGPMEPSRLSVQEEERFR